MGELNQNQKILLVAAFVVFFVSSIGMFVVALPYINASDLKNALSNKTISVVTKNGTDTTKTEFAYGDKIDNSDASEISFENNALIANGGYSLTIDSTKNINATNLIAYFNFQTPVSITFSNVPLQITANTTGIIDSRTKSVIILTGKFDVNGTTVQANSLVVLQGTDYVVKTFDRTALSQNKDYKNLITVIGNFAAVP